MQLNHTTASTRLTPATTTGDSRHPTSIDITPGLGPRSLDREFARAMATLEAAGLPFVVVHEGADDLCECRRGRESLAA